MFRNDLTFNRVLSKEENEAFKKNGNIQHNNQKICPYLEQSVNYYDSIEIYDDAFYQQLRNAVIKNSPVWASVIMNSFLILFLVGCILSLTKGTSEELRNSDSYSISCIATILPVGAFCYFTRSLIKESARLSQLLKCIEIRENVCPISLIIDGKRLYTDTSGDVSQIYYYIYCEPMLISVPKKNLSYSFPKYKIDRSSD